MTDAADSLKISFVIPVYNEASNIPLLYRELTSVLETLSYQREFIFVNDGSTDNSLTIIKQLARNDRDVFYIDLSRNFGHQYALKAGMDNSTGDCVISMDCDLQHPPEIVKSLIEKWEEGYDVAYTTREDDPRLPYLKRKTSALFYAILNRLSDLQLEKGTADFRLMSRNVLNAFMHLNESELFIRGLVKWAGFRQTAIQYSPRERYSGESKYNLKKMVSLGVKGIMAFSVKPLRLIALMGIIFFLISIVLIPYALISYFMDSAVSGWTSLIITVIFFGSLQLLMMGIMGLYIGKIVIQSKNRPLYFIRETNYMIRLKERERPGA